MFLENFPIFFWLDIISMLKLPINSNKLCVVSILFSYHIFFIIVSLQYIVVGITMNFQWKYCKLKKDGNRHFSQ